MRTDGHAPWGVVEIAPGGGERAAGELAGGDLAGLAEVAQREGAEVVGMHRQPADRVVAEGLRPGPLHRARGELAELVVPAALPNARLS